MLVVHLPQRVLVDLLLLRGVGRRVEVHEIDPALVLEAIAHAVWAPNHKLTEPWRFRLIGAETKERICVLNAELARDKAGDRAASIKLARWRAIPGWMLLTCVQAGHEVQRREDYAACCCAARR